MDIFYTILIALWSYPLITLYLVRSHGKNGIVRKTTTYVSLGLMVIATFGLVTNISTTSLTVDWIILSFFYFFVSFVLWLGLFGRNKIFKALSSFAAMLIWGAGYFYSTIGIQGIGFIAMDHTPKKTIRISDRVYYKEYEAGNAPDDWRGVRVCLFENFSTFPIFERQFFERDYISSSRHDFHSFSGEIHVNYFPEKQALVLSDTAKNSDTLHIMER